MKTEMDDAALVASALMITSRKPTREQSLCRNEFPHISLIPFPLTTVKSLRMSSLFEAKMRFQWLIKIKLYRLP